MKKEQIKKMVKELEERMKEQIKTKTYLKQMNDKSLFGIICQLEGEIFAKQEIINELKKYL